MKSIILNILNARPEEANRVFLLLGQGFFTGIFLALYDVGAVSVFLEHFEENTLAWGLFASGATGIVLTTLFSYLQARISFQKLVIGFLVLMAIGDFAVWYGLTKFPDNDPFVFVSFIFALPFSYIGLLIFWGTFGRLFTVRQAKRIIGSIDTGQLIAAIFALFIVGSLIDNDILVAKDLFLISLVSMSGLLLFFTFITSNYPLKKEGESDRKQTYPIPKMMANKYLRLMAMFVIISMVAATFVDFTFLNATKIQWNNDASDIGAFVARFEAAVVIFSFLFQTFVTDYIIDNYGLKISLLVNPILIILLTTIAGMIGLIYVDSDFTMFFLTVAITKLFIDSLKDALDGPTFKLYFLPIDSKVRFDVSTKIEGTVTAFASMLAGLLLVGLNEIKGQLGLQVEIILVVVIFILIPILVVWFITTGNMHTSYKNTLRAALETIKGKSVQRAPNYKAVIAKENIQNDEPAVYYSLKLMERLDPGAFESSLGSINPDVQPEGRLDRLIKKVELKNEKTKELASKALAWASIVGGSKLDNKDLYELSKAPGSQYKIAAALHLREHINDENVFVLLDLLRDFSPAVRHEALNTARLVKRVETWNIIAELLDHPDFANEAAAALVEGGDDSVLPVLDQLFTKSEKSKDSLLLAVKVMGEITTHQALEQLWQQIEYPDRKIIREVLVTLQKNNVRAIGDKVQRVNAQLDLEIGKAIWNLAAISELKDSQANARLLGSLHKEVASNFEFIYIYMSLLYDPASIQLVKDNVESGTTEGITYAIELLDVFINKELRPKLYPILEDTPIAEKLEKLQIFYPRVSFNELQTLNYIINRDFNMINRWTKACALDSLLSQPKTTVNEGLIGHLFNPDHLLAENAAKVIKQVDESKFDLVLERLPDKRRYYLMNRFRDVMAHEQLGRFPLLFERICHMRELAIFGKVSGLHVSELVDKFQVVKTKAGEIPELDRIKGRNPLIIVDSGTVEITNGMSALVKEDEVFSAFFFETFSLNECEIRSETDSVMYLLDINDYLSVLINYKELAMETMAVIESFDKYKTAIAV